MKLIVAKNHKKRAGLLMQWYKSHKQYNLKFFIANCDYFLKPIFAVFPGKSKKKK